MDYAELLGEITGGVLKLPNFQRPIVWDLNQTRLLLDSIVKGFPIGTFVLWESADVMKAHRNIGNLELREVRDGRLVKYVLDGQQRITSIYASLKEAVVNDQRYRILCDLDSTNASDEIFSLEGEDRTRFVPLSEILGEGSLLKLVGLPEKRIRRYDEIRQAFKEYKFSVVTVKDMPFEQVCEIFSRINNTGTDLSVFDLMVARTWSGDFDLRSRYDELVADLATAKFEGLYASAILQSVSCVIKRSCTRKSILSITRTEMKDSWDHSVQCLKMAVDFLRSSIGIPGWRLLPYHSITPALAYFFHANETRRASAHQAKGLSRYFWRVCLSERYSSGSETRIGADLDEIDKILAEAEDRFSFYPRIEPAALQRSELTLGSAYCKAILCYLASLRPRDFEDNSVVNLENTNLAQKNSRHFHHFFPTNHLKRAGIEGPISNSVVNICLVSADSNLRMSDDAPRDYLAEIGGRNPTLETTLRTHAIGDFEEFGIGSDNYRGFLERRSALIWEALEQLCLYEDEFDAMHTPAEESPSDDT